MIRISGRAKRLEQPRATADLELRKRQIYGLLIIAAVMLVISLCRIPLRDVFPPGWWRAW